MLGSRKSLRGSIIEIGVIALALALLAGAMYHFTDEGKARRAVEELGYTNVTVIDKSVAWPFTGCSEEDDAKFAVRGTGPDGKVRIVTVCAGPFKGGTVRAL